MRHLDPTAFMPDGVQSYLSAQVFGKRAPQLGGGVSGTFGDASHVAQLTLVDGRVMKASNVALSGGGGTLADLAAIGVFTPWR